MAKITKIDLDEFRAMLYVEIIEKHYDEWKKAHEHLRPGQLIMHFDSSFKADFQFNFYPSRNKKDIA